MKILSVDLETTGLDATRHYVLSIGAVCPSTHDHFHVEFAWKEMLVTPIAMQINQIDLRIKNPQAKSPQDAMELFEQWLGKNGIRGHEECRILGKNPTGIDRPMLAKLWDEYRAYLPAPVKFPFSHRTVDLNTLFAGIAEANGLDTDKVRAEVGELAKRQLVQQVPDVAALGQHHALNDAYWNIFAWRECLNRIRTPVATTTTISGPIHVVKEDGTTVLFDPALEDDNARE